MEDKKINKKIAWVEPGGKKRKRKTFKKIGRNGYIEHQRQKKIINWKESIGGDGKILSRYRSLRSVYLLINVFSVKNLCSERNHFTSFS